MSARVVFALLASVAVGTAGAMDPPRRETHPTCAETLPPWKQAAAGKVASYHRLKATSVIELLTDVEGVAAKLPPELVSRYRAEAAGLTAEQPLDEAVLRHLVSQLAAYFPAKAKFGESPLHRHSKAQPDPKLAPAVAFLEGYPDVGTPFDVIPVIVFDPAARAHPLFGFGGGSGRASSFHLCREPFSFRPPVGVWLAEPEDPGDVPTGIGLEVRSGSRLTEAVMTELLGAPGWVAIESPLWDGDDARLRSAILVHEIIHFFDMRADRPWMRNPWRSEEDERHLGEARRLGLEAQLADAYVYLHRRGEKRAFWGSLQYLKSQGMPRAEAAALVVAESGAANLLGARAQNWMEEWYALATAP